MIPHASVAKLYPLAHVSFLATSLGHIALPSPTGKPCIYTMYAVPSQYTEVCAHWSPRVCSLSCDFGLRCDCTACTIRFFCSPVFLEQSGSVAAAGCHSVELHHRASVQWALGDHELAIFREHCKRQMMQARPTARSTIIATHAKRKRFYTRSFSIGRYISLFVCLIN